MHYYVHHSRSIPGVMPTCMPSIVVDDEQAVTYGCLMEWAEALTAHLSEGWIGVRGAEEKRPGWFGGCPPVAEVGNGGCDLSPPPLFMSFKIPPNNNA